MAWFSTQVKNRLKRTRASTHPCLTPLEMLKGSDASSPESTCPVLSSWNWRNRFNGQAPQLEQNHPKGLSVDHVEGFRQVYEDSKRGSFSVRCTSPASDVQRRSCR